MSRPIIIDIVILCYYYAMTILEKDVISLLTLSDNLFTLNQRYKLDNSLSIELKVDLDHGAT